MGEPAKPPNWLDLPEHVTAEIFSKVGAVDVLNNVQRVCTSWQSIGKDPSMWRIIDMRKLGDYDLEVMCRHAVGRSNGQLEYISIQYFGTDDLLNYIADRSSRLRCLRLVDCPKISDEGLSETVAKHPLLEELELSLSNDLTEEALKVVGRSCPLLKSFKWNCVPCRSHYIDSGCDKEALAIAEYMHGLRHL